MKDTSVSKEVLQHALTGSLMTRMMAVNMEGKEYPSIGEIIDLVMPVITAYTEQQKLDEKQKADRRIRWLKLNWHSHNDYENAKLEAVRTALQDALHQGELGGEAVLVEHIKHRLTHLKANGEETE